MRATRDRGTLGYPAQLDGERLAREATSGADRLKRLRNALESSHAVRTSADVDAVAQSFVKNVPAGDPHRSEIVSEALEIASQQRDAFATAPQRKVAQIEASLAKSPQALWRAKIRGIAEETGLDNDLVEEFLRAEDEARTFPGVIEPRSVPILQEMPGLAPMYMIAAVAIATPEALGSMTAAQWGQLALYMTPYIGSGLNGLEAVTGKSVFDGQKLATWERLLNVALIVIPVAKGLIRAGKGVARLARNTLRLRAAYKTAAPAFLAVSRGTGRSMEALLRQVAKLGRMDAAKLASLERRISAASRARTALSLGKEDAAIARTFEQYVATSVEAASLAKAMGKVAQPTLQNILATAAQQKVGQRILGRVFAHAGVAASNAERAAETAASSLRRALASHLNKAVSRARGGADGAARRAFAAMSRPLKSGETLGNVVRKSLFDPIRKRTIELIKADKKLVQLLESEAGIFVGTEKGERGLFMRGVSTSGETVNVGLDFDHAEEGLAQAVDAARTSGDYRKLLSIIGADNLQLLTSRENSAVIETLRRVSAPWGH